MKNIIYVLGVLVLGYMVYNVVKSGETDIDDTLEKPIVNNFLQTQPQQIFPLQMVETPRVDNANQPWYGGSRDFMGSSVSDFAIFGMSDDTRFMSYNTNKMWQDLASTYQ